MTTGYDIVCGGLDIDRPKALALNLWGSPKKTNVMLKLDDLSPELGKDIAPQFLDLVEIATYVYAADQAISRTRPDVDTFGGNWHRTFRLHIPVRCPSLWRGSEVMESLTTLLGFLSDDYFEFAFHSAETPGEVSAYLDLWQGTPFLNPPEQVMLFSGGLDSLAGAIEETVIQKRPVVLVSHKSTPKNNGYLSTLGALLREKAAPIQPIPIGVRANKNKALGKEFTQRTRSFLFAAFGVTIAQILGLKSLRFYENGVVSLNLPICAQVVGGRATRTTHPRVLNGFQKLFSLLSGEQFTVENPFLWKTRAEIIRVITDAGCGDFIRQSISCAHTMERTSDHPHCGTCSQCVDRRFGIIAADAEALDPDNQFKIDIFTESRPKDEDKIMLSSFIERANRVDRISNSVAFMAEFPEIRRALAHLPGNPMSSAERLFHLYKKHASEVKGALGTMVGRHAAKIVSRSLPGDCLLRTVIEARTISSVEVDADNPPPIPQQPPNRFVWSGDRWEVAFKGSKPIYLEDWDGIRYIAFLLNNPEKEFRHLELYRWLKPEEDPHYADAFFASGAAEGFEAADDATIEAVETRMKEISLEIKDAREAGDHNRVEELAEEEQKARTYLNSVKRPKGPARKIGSADESARSTVLQAIKRAKNRIRRSRSALAHHLKQLADKDTPGALVYKPDEKIEWLIQFPPPKKTR